MAKYLAIILLAAIAFARPALGQQSMSAIDSLERLAETAPDTALPKVYYELSQMLRYTKPLKGISCAIKQIDLASMQGRPDYLALGYCALAASERNADMLGQSLEHYNEALSLARQNNLVDLEASCYNSIGRVAIDLGLIDSAEYCVDRAIEIGKALRDSVVLADAYMNSGIIWRGKGRIQKAIRYLSMSCRLRTMLNSLSVEGLAPFWHLSDLYLENGEFSKAKEIINSQLSRRDLRSSSLQMSTLWYRLSQVYYKTNVLDSAEFACNKAKSEAIKVFNFRCLSQSFRMFDSIYISMGNYRKAADYCNRFINICDNVFQTSMEDELNKTQYTPQYVENQKNIIDSNHSRSVSLVMLALSLIGLVFCVYGICGLMSKSHKIKKLNEQLSSNEASMERSLEFTRAIQMAVQPRIEDGDTVFSDYSLLYIPRDIVSGDFFWKYTDSRCEIVAVADCTGHGVPGAMLTMLGASMLQDIATSGERDAGAILNELRRRIKFMMGINGLNRMQDGMDISLAVIEKSTMRLDFAGAFNSLLLVRGGEMTELKATRCPIGEYVKEPSFVTQSIQLLKGDCIYMATDGFTSQFGGPDKSKMPHNRLRELIMENTDLPMSQLRDRLSQYFSDWKGNVEQVDDVTVAGFKC